MAQGIEKTSAEDVETVAAEELEKLAVISEQFDVAIPTLRTWIRTGQLRAFRLGPRMVRVRPADVAKLMRPM